VIWWVYVTDVWSLEVWPDALKHIYHVNQFLRFSLLYPPNQCSAMSTNQSKPGQVYNNNDNEVTIEFNLTAKNSAVT
jgi:hypothetical protein